MATPIDFPASNIPLGPGPTCPGVGWLRAYQTPPGHQPEAFVTCHKLDPEELAEVARTGVVWLHVMGLGHPPVLITGRDPFRPSPGEAPAPEPTSPEGAAG